MASASGSEEAAPCRRAAGGDSLLLGLGGPVLVEQRLAEDRRGPGRARVGAERAASAACSAPGEVAGGEARLGELGQGVARACWPRPPSRSRRRPGAGRRSSGAASPRRRAPRGLGVAGEGVAHRLVVARPPVEVAHLGGEAGQRQHRVGRGGRLRVAGRIFWAISLTAFRSRLATAWPKALASAFSATSVSARDGSSAIFEQPA